MHPAVQEAKAQINQMEEEANTLLLRVQSGFLTDMTRTLISAVLRAARRYYPHVREYLTKGWAGAEEWMLLKLNTIISICEIALAEFKKVPAPFTAAFAE